MSRAGKPVVFDIPDEERWATKLVTVIQVDSLPVLEEEQLIPLLVEISRVANYPTEVPNNELNEQEEVESPTRTCCNCWLM